jgi:iron complex transport system permease protein
MRFPFLIGGLVVLAAAAFTLSLLVGPAAIGVGDLPALIGGGDLDTAGLIMREIRLPRTLLGFLIGASLGLSGAALQGYLRNPLAEPGVIGVSALAAFGAVIAIYTGASVAAPWALPLMAIGGSALAVLILQACAGSRGVLSLILVGVALSSLASALISLALSLSPNPYASLEIVFWLLGSLSDRSMEQVWLVLPFTLAGWLLIAGAARALDVLSLGEEAAAGLGVDLGRTRLLIVAGTALAVGAGTAVAGVIGFVGLVVPHLLRPLVGHRPSRLLAASALGGALLVLLADVLVRVITPDAELKLGVVTALLGAPFFLYLALASRAHFPA